MRAPRKAMPEAFAKYPDVDEVRGVAAQRVQAYQVDRQASEQRATKKCAADGCFAKVFACTPDGEYDGCLRAGKVGMALMSKFQ